MHKRTNTTIEEVNQSIQELSLQWNVSEQDNLRIATCLIGLQLRKLRLMRGKTQSRVAKAVNVTFQQIQKYEKGTNGVSSNRLMQLSQFLNVPITYFFEDFKEFKDVNTREDELEDLNYSFLSRTFSALSKIQKEKILQILNNTAKFEKVG